MKIRLEKHTVCADCLSVDIVYSNCICTYENKYPKIELEFEVCECCGSINNSPADSEFNIKQLKELKNE